MNKKAKIILIVVGVLFLLTITNPTGVEDHTNAIYDSLMESEGRISKETIMIIMDGFNENYKVDNYLLFSIGSIKYIDDPTKTFGILGQTFML